MPELKKRNTMYLLFDIGATNTRLAVSKDLQSFQEPRIIPTDQSFDVAVKNMVATALELSKGEHILAAAGGIAGPLDKEKSKLVVAPNIPDWENKPLQKELEGAYDVGDEDTRNLPLSNWLQGKLKANQALKDFVKSYADTQGVLVGRESS